jgi:hypothetical protein
LLEGYGFHSHYRRLRRTRYPFCRLNSGPCSYRAIRVHCIGSRCRRVGSSAVHHCGANRCESAISIEGYKTDAGERAGYYRWGDNEPGVCSREAALQSADRAFFGLGLGQGRQAQSECGDCADGESHCDAATCHNRLLTSTNGVPGGDHADRVFPFPLVQSAADAQKRPRFLYIFS